MLMRFVLEIRVSLLSQSAIGGLLAVVAISHLTPSEAQTVNNGELLALKAETEKMFQKHITPFIKQHCIQCHSNRKPTEAGVNFSPALNAPGHAAFTEQWASAVARVKAHDMPPEYEDQPSDEERERFIRWQLNLKYLSPKDPGPFVIRRLTKTEYGNTLHDLFGVDGSIVDALPDEVGGAGYLNSISQLQLEQYLAIAEEVLDQVFKSDNGTASRFKKNWLKRPPGPAKSDRKTAKQVAARVAKLAYRRPPSSTEIEVLLNVFDLGRQNDLAYSDALRLMLKSLLVSPQFLFITPAKTVTWDAEIIPLDDYQLASRLSYLLWATMPDRELMDLADRAELHQPEVLEAQVVRMLNDPRSRALFDGFAAQWLGISDLMERSFDEKLFPQMNNRLRTAMVDEARLLFENIVRENQSVVRLLDSEYSFLNEDLAAIYGIEEPVSGPEFRKVRLTNENRGGILGMPATLAATSFPNRTSPVNRGVYVLERILGEHVPAAPPDVPALEGQSASSIEDLTLRQRTEMHRKDPVCANCHQLLDPIGFGLENFDAIGRWRERDESGQPIDASGELPGGKHFANPKELKAMLMDRADDFSRNVVERLLAYALCRQLEGYDEIVVDGLMQRVSRDDHRIQTLIRAVVTSYPFTHRRINQE